MPSIKSVRKAAASATYRKVVNKTAAVLRVKPEHTQLPSDDYNNVLTLVDEKSRERALEWYRRGLRRGFDEATTAVVNGSLSLSGDESACPKKVVIPVMVKFRGQPQKKLEFTFTAKELGFK